MCLTWSGYISEKKGFDTKQNHQGILANGFVPAWGSQSTIGSCCSLLLLLIWLFESIEIKQITVRWRWCLPKSFPALLVCQVHPRPKLQGVFWAEMWIIDGGAVGYANKHCDLVHFIALHCARWLKVTEWLKIVLGPKPFCVWLVGFFCLFAYYLSKQPGLCLCFLA